MLASSSFVEELKSANDELELLNFSRDYEKERPRIEKYEKAEPLIGRFEEAKTKEDQYGETEFKVK